MTFYVILRFLVAILTLILTVQTLRVCLETKLPVENIWSCTFLSISDFDVFMCHGTRG